MALHGCPTVISRVNLAPVRSWALVRVLCCWPKCHGRVMGSAFCVVARAWRVGFVAMVGRLYCWAMVLRELRRGRWSLSLRRQGRTAHCPLCHAPRRTVVWRLGLLAALGRSLSDGTANGGRCHPPPVSRLATTPTSSPSTPYLAAHPTPVLPWGPLRVGAADRAVERSAVVTSRAESW